MAFKDIIDYVIDSKVLFGATFTIVGGFLGGLGTLTMKILDGPISNWKEKRKRFHQDKHQYFTSLNYIFNDLYNNIREVFNFQLFLYKRYSQLNIYQKEEVIKKYQNLLSDYNTTLDKLNEKLRSNIFFNPELKELINKFTHDLIDKNIYYDLSIAKKTRDGFFIPNEFGINSDMDYETLIKTITKDSEDIFYQIKKNCY